MDNITVMSNAAGSWALLGRFPDTQETRTTLALLKDGASRFEPVKDGGN